MNREKTKKEKQPYKGFDFRERLAPTILLAVAIPFTVMVCGVFEIFGNNLGEFNFALFDFFGFNLLFMLLAAGVITAILLPLRGRVFDIVYALFFWIAIMLFVQGNYLTLGMSSLEGDGVGNGAMTRGQIMVNVIIWLAVGGWLLFGMLSFKKRDILKLIMTVGMVTVIGMQLISCATVSLTTNVYKTPEERAEIAINSSDTEGGGADTETEAAVGSAYLTYKNLDRVSANKNVIVFIVDRFDNEYIETLEEDCPELLSELDGFTFFNDTMSLYPRTYPAVPYLATGVENDFVGSRQNYLKNAYLNSDFLKLLDQNGYDINIYTDSYYGYENAIYMPYADNSSGSVESRVENKLGLSRDMVRLSLYRYLPFFARSSVGSISSSDFGKYVVYDEAAPKYTTDMKDMWEYMNAHPLTLGENGENRNNYSFIHIDGCHLPNKYDADFGEIGEDEKYSTETALRQSFKIINKYISEMKELGVYDDATVIITGDHASIKSDSKNPYESHVTALYVKRAGDSFEGIQKSQAQVSHEDLFATIIDSEGIETDTDFGRSVFDIGEDEQRTRRYIFQTYKSSDKTYDIVEYEITGSSHDFENNWKIVNTYSLGKSIYD